MKISIADLRRGPREIGFQLPSAELGLAVEGFSFPEPVAGKVRFQLFGKRVLARGRLETAIAAACVRCLAPIRQRIEAPIELVFEPRPVEGEASPAAVAAEWEAEGHEIDYYDEETVDPTDSLRQIVLLELPDYPLCRNECRGLCPQCGADLNSAPCRCGKRVDAAGEPDWKARLREIHLS